MVKKTGHAATNVTPVTRHGHTMGCRPGIVADSNASRDTVINGHNSWHTCSFAMKLRRYGILSIPEGLVVLEHELVRNCFGDKPPLHPIEIDGPRSSSPEVPTAVLVSTEQGVSG